ncbi:unnamed protein product [Leptosia nina]|uniref:Crossover junction endonuclease MUS81 n=1 Tax=Leptosia nina TaxID=320188 RepID=A0AAV1K096_9NEOP
MCNANEPGKRITYRRKNPNLVLEKCLQKLYAEAREKNSKHEPVLREAMSSLSKYPLPLKSGAECAILKGFSRPLCMLLDKYLSESCLKDNNKDIPHAEHYVSPMKSSDAGASTDVNGEGSQGDKQLCKKGTYKPAFRSGGYGILLGLLEHTRKNLSNALKKEDLIEIAQKYCEESYVVSKSVRYSAWSSIARLLTKGLVKKSGGKKIEYSLTEEGLLVADKLWEENENKPSSNDVIFNNSTSKVLNVLSENVHHVKFSFREDMGKINEKYGLDDHIINMPPGSYDIILIIDKNEKNGNSDRQDPFRIYPDLRYESRSLKVGDFTWVARHKEYGWELVLPYIVERKRMDDLGASIKDGRFHEQKFRLRKCGLQNVFYLVESHDKNKHVGLPLPSLMQALANTRIQDGFKVYFTDSLIKSQRFLAMMTKRIIVEYKNKQLRGTNDTVNGLLMTFDYFNKSSVKSKILTVTEMFLKVLLQLKGMSVEKALGIIKVYKTPKSLISAYQDCDEKVGANLLANLKYGDLNRNLGPSLSKAVFHLFT